ncbi:hypothetical protein CB0940_09045 [Cercospora beticola]|uniref:FAD-binding domain-containing protein n=1 Tax=Cercospora beticola TaxID=122368 RepID=A0A2G5HGA3_CERBT|nr:hypothetical protein CB0940_09045 [Cercospora beticola]PIA91570.1 hypothetical protein CB0940_09045 [Cercospora beticola]WPB06680.1 hypothetical protein RHO25_011339 [Cercospora beticola]
MSTFKVIIIGGGLSGNVLANGLMQSNIEVQVYERMSQHSRREGYQIRLGENALIGMRACLPQEVLSRVISKMGRHGGKRDLAPVIYSTGFEKLCDLSKLPAYPKSAPINRGVLRDVLAEPVERAGRMVYEKQFERYGIVKEDHGERVRVVFGDGTSEICDILIGADGSHSRVNATLGLKNLRAMDDKISFIVKSDLKTAQLLTMSHEILQTSLATMDDEMVLFWATYLPDKVDTSNAEAIRQYQKDIPVDDEMSSCMLVMTFLSKVVPEGIASASSEEKWEFMRKKIANWSPYYTEAMNAVKGEDIYCFTPRESSEPALGCRDQVANPEIPERGHPRVWLLGDAIHAMLPGRGMGGNQAILDTSVMLPLLKQLAEESTSYLPESRIRKACNDCERQVIPRVFPWVRKSSQLSHAFDSGKLTTRLMFRAINLGVLLLRAVYAVVGVFVDIQPAVPPELEN